MNRIIKSNLRLIQNKYLLKAFGKGFSVRFLLRKFLASTGNMKLLPLIAVLAAGSSTAFAKRVVCYYSNWSKYGDDPYQIENTDASLCTHLVYTFFKLNEDGRIASQDPWNDLGDSWTTGGMERFVKLRKQNPFAKFLIGVGGWNQGPANFQAMVKSPEKRKAFLESSLLFIELFKFDGLEIDWIYQPGTSGDASDKAGLSALVKEMKAVFQEKNFLLSLSTSPLPTIFDSSYDIAFLTKNLDFVNVLTYDLRGSWDGKTGHVAPLHALDTDPPELREINVESIIDRYISKGAIPEKLNLAMVAYGRTFTLFSPDNSGVNAPAKGPGRVEPLSFRKFCLQDKNKQWTKFWVDKQKVPYAVSGNQWVGYEDIRSLKEKVKFGKSRKLGGFSMWSFEKDDFTGQCGLGKFPLLNAIKEELSK